MFQLYFCPLNDWIENTRTVVNEITVLIVVYHMICFSDFVQSTEA